MIEFADTLLRGGAIGVYALLMIRTAGARPFIAGPAAAFALSFGMIVYIFVSAPGQPPTALDPMLRKIPAANPFLIWLAGLSIFEDRFRFRRWHAVPAALTILPVFAEPLHPFRFAAVAALYLHLAWVAYATAAGDLVAARIAFRRVFFAVAALTGLIVTYVEATLTGPPPPPLMLLHAAAMACLAGAFHHWSHRLAPDVWPAQAAPRTRVKDIPESDPLLARLNAAMAAEIWRTEGLSIGALAAELGAPEHRLRKLINQRLGHRNFASFINAARIDAAATALADSTQAEKQILAIAHESGFASLGPFNRAFRAEKGLSPGEWRARAIAPARRN